LQWESTSRRVAGLSILLLLVACAVTSSAVGTQSKPTKQPTITIVSATYGGSCEAPIGNATETLGALCDDMVQCNHRVDNRPGNSDIACGKDFFVQFRCGDDPAIRRAGHRPERTEAYYIVVISCSRTSLALAHLAAHPALLSSLPTPPPLPAPGIGINVLSATYGASCGAPRGNATANVAGECHDRKRCCYPIDDRYGDPARGCTKSFSVEYRCGHDPTVRQATFPAASPQGYDVATLNCFDPSIAIPCISNWPPQLEEDLD